MGPSPEEVADALLASKLGPGVEDGKAKSEIGPALAVEARKIRTWCFVHGIDPVQAPTTAHKGTRDWLIVPKLPTI